MDERIIPRHGDYVMIHGYSVMDMVFSTVKRCVWRDEKYRHFGIIAENGNDMSVIREPAIDTNNHKGWKAEYWWVAEANRIPVNQMGEN